MDELLRSCLTGDPEARDRFVDAHAPVVFSIVRRVVGAGRSTDPAVAIEDVMQEVFLKLFRKDARLLRAHDPSRASLSTWLAIVARSTALDILRRKRLPTVPIGSALARGGEPAAPPERLDLPTNESARGATSQVPLDLLSPRQKLVLQLMYDRGLAVDEVARTLGIKEQSVRSAKHKALTRLRALFGTSRAGEEGPEGGDASRRPTV